MTDAWDIFPSPPNPRYPVRLPPKKGAKGFPSPEELADTENRRQEACDDIRKDYERQLEEARRKWPRQRVTQVQDRIEYLRLCQKTPGTERRDLSGCVYLMWCPSLRAYKVGQTDDLWRRTREHQRKLDSKIEHRVIYYTPLPSLLLERFLLCHFLYFRVRQDISEELFELPQKQADGFEATAKEIERHLLAIEIVRLKALLLKFEAECLEVGEGQLRRCAKNDHRDPTHRE